VSKVGGRLTHHYRRGISHLDNIHRSRFKALLLSLVGVLVLLLVWFLAYAFFLSGLRIESPPYRIDWRIHPAIVFESDDWGQMRLFPNMELLEEGVRLIPSASRDFYQRNSKHLTDTLESPADMEELFAVLKKHRGGDGLPVVFTANYIIGSPDYTKIRDNNFRKFFSQILPSVPILWKRGDILSKAREGIALGVWEPEYHGLVHMNPFKWIETLRNSETADRRLFELETYAGTNGFNSQEYAPELSDEQQVALIDEGIKAFREVFGRLPVSVFASYETWQTRTETFLSQKGVSIIQGKNLQNLQSRPLLVKFAGKILNILGYKDADKPWQLDMGEKNAKTKVMYLLRNIEFEPSVEEVDWDNTFSAIMAAWSSGKPAIIAVHRFNFASVRPGDRDVSIRRLDDLLRKIKDQRPDVVFLTDQELAQIYNRGYSVRQFGEQIVIRNFTGEKRTVDVNIPEETRIREIYFFPQQEMTAEAPPTNNRLVVPTHATCVVRMTPPFPVGGGMLPRSR
jgi:hypothetical protein